MKLERKEDRRVERTKHDLKEAFIKLLQMETDLKKISIINIVNEANYNRATFYAHYEDKYQLIEEIKQDAINGFLTAFREPYQQNKAIDFHQLSAKTVKIFNYIKEHDILFTTLFTNPIFIAFPKEFVQVIEELFAREIIYLDTKIHDINKELLIRSNAYSILGLIQYWIDQKFEYDAQYMTEQMLKISKFEVNKFKTNI